MEDEGGAFEGMQREGEMKASKIVASVIGLFVLLPMWMLLIYQVLASTNQSTWVWVLYWMYLPISILVSILTKIVEIMED